MAVDTSLLCASERHFQQSQVNERAGSRLLQQDGFSGRGVVAFGYSVICRLYATVSNMRGLLFISLLSVLSPIQIMQASKMFRSRVLSHSRRLFSSTARRPIMDLTGFSENQLTVRDAISSICANFPNTYWQECDQQERDPKEFHAALARDGWLGIALPEENGGAGLGRTYSNKRQKDSC